MANALPPIVPLTSSISLVAVEVRSVSLHGVIELAPATQDWQSTPIPPHVKLPIPNFKASALVIRTLLEKTFAWLRIGGGIVEYNIFLDAAGGNVTFNLYMQIVNMHEYTDMLPREGGREMCRISPICDDTQLYIQTQPEYVDTVSYAIYLGIGDKKFNNMIGPAEDIVIGNVYLYADRVNNYRVKLVQRNVKPKPNWYTNSMNSRVSTERETTVSTTCNPVREHENERFGVPSVCGGGGSYGVPIVCGGGGGYGVPIVCGGGGGYGVSSVFGSGECYGVPSPLNLFNKIWDEQVEVFRIDYGGPLIVVPRVHLYKAESVCPALKRFNPMAVPVNVRFINGSFFNKNAQIEHLRSQQANIQIVTVVRGTKEIPMTVDIEY